MSLYVQTSITVNERTQRLKWLGHVYRFPDGRARKTAIHRRAEELVTKGCPKKQWFLAMEEDLDVLSVKNRKAAMEMEKQC